MFKPFHRALSRPFYRALSRPFYRALSRPFYRALSRPFYKACSTPFYRAPLRYICISKDIFISGLLCFMSLVYKTELLNVNQLWVMV
jgi:hypothetical protein